MNQAHRQHRHHRLRSRVHGTSLRPRVSVFRSIKNIEIQFIDDESQKTLVSTRLKVEDKRSKIEQATAVGLAATAAAKAAGISQVVFDRGGYVYHGRVKAVAEALREGGLVF